MEFLAETMKLYVVKGLKEVTTNEVVLNTTNDSARMRDSCSMTVIL